MLLLYTVYFYNYLKQQMFNISKPYPTHKHTRISLSPLVSQSGHYTYKPFNSHAFCMSLKHLPIASRSHATGHISHIKHY